MPTEPHQLFEIAEAIEEICAVIRLKRWKPFEKSRSKCYNCYKLWHFECECTETCWTQYRGPSSSSSTARVGSYNNPQLTKTQRRWKQNAVEEENLDANPNGEDEHEQTT